MMEYWVYRMVIIGLIPACVYDIFTSFVGAVCLFKLQSSSPIYLWGLPIAIAIGAFCLNLITRSVWDKTSGLRGMILVWIGFLAYDFYTSFLGVAHVIHTGDIFHLKLSGIAKIVGVLSVEETLATGVIASLVVASPMTMFLVIRKAGQLQDRQPTDIS